MNWLLLNIGCAECAGGWEPLVNSVEVLPSVEAAKALAEEADGKTLWRGRDDGGCYEHSGSGGWEIVPLPDSK
jgi:hypothetical protein